MKLRAITHQANEGGFWAEVPAIPGCLTEGDTMEELLANIQDAVEGCLSVEVDSSSPADSDQVVEIVIEHRARMLELLENNRGQIVDLCRRHSVKRLELFGSVARGEAGAASDVDFLVEFISYDDPQIADHWFGLQEDLQRLLGRDVDLTSLRTAKNRDFLQLASRDKVTLYAA